MDDQCADFLQQFFRLKRFSDEIIHTSSIASVHLFLHDIGGQRNDGDVGFLSFQGMNFPSRLIAIHHWHLHIHQHDIENIHLHFLYCNRSILTAIQSGAKGYLLKNSLPEDVIWAIRSVLRNGFYFKESISQLLLRGLVENKLQKPIIEEKELLTQREREVLELICKEMTNKEIAEQLHLSPRTVESYRKNMLEKIGARNTVGLVLYAIKHGIIQLEEVREDTWEYVFTSKVEAELIEFAFQPTVYRFMPTSETPIMILPGDTVAIFGREKHEDEVWINECKSNIQLEQRSLHRKRL